MAKTGSYDSDVFVNCPFDHDYQPIFDAIIFTVLVCGYRPRCALEIQDSGAVRLKRITDLIRHCALGIHDISRTELDPGSGLPRFNMPFELGLFIGAQTYGSGMQKRKKCVILDREMYRFQAYLSDIGGQDIKTHAGSPASAMTAARDFLRAAQDVSLPGPAAISSNYQSFEAFRPALLDLYEIKPGEDTYPDRLFMMTEWLKTRHLTR